MNREHRPIATCVTAGSPSGMAEDLNITGCIDLYATTRRWAPKTRRGQRYALQHFAATCGVDRFDQLDADAVTAWWSTLTTLCASTARARRSTVKNFLSWARHTGRIDGDPMAVIPIPREPRRVPVTIAADDIDRLWRVLPDVRAHAIAELMLTIGLRCCDVARLEVHDVDLDRLTIAITGKGGHRDLLPLPRSAADAIRAYLRQHPAPAGPLIRDGRWHRHPLTAQWLSDLFRAWMSDAGLKVRPYDGHGAHALRRTCATTLLDRGATVRQVQAVLRHESLQSTARYLRMSECEELRPVVELGQRAA